MPFSLVLALFRLPAFSRFCRRLLLFPRYFLYILFFILYFQFFFLSQLPLSLPCILSAFRRNAKHISESMLLCVHVCACVCVPMAEPFLSDLPTTFATVATVDCRLQQIPNISAPFSPLPFSQTQFSAPMMFSSFLCCILSSARWQP